MMLEMLLKQDSKTSNNMKYVKVFEQFINELNEKKSWYDFKPVEIAKSFMKDYDKSADSDDLDSWLDEFAYDKKIEAALNSSVAKEIVDELNAKGYKNLKHNDLTVNEAFALNKLGNVYDLESAGVEVPDFRIDISNLRAQRLAIIEMLKKMESFRKALKNDPNLQIDKDKIEKELETMVKVYNTDSKKAYQQFEKVLKAVKFPSDAKYTVEFKEEPNGEYLHPASAPFMDFDERKPMKLFTMYIKPKYYFLAPRKRNEQKFSPGGNDWAGIIEGRVAVGFVQALYAPEVLDKEWILNTFLNSDNMLR
jgi:hypothetical protein